MAAPHWSFADFHLDSANACLWQGPQVIALTPKAFDVLYYLVTHPDRVVTKDTLLEAVWPETAVSDAVVRIAIGELRRALGDTAQTPRLIATVPRRGYRLLAAVTEVMPPEAGAAEGQWRPPVVPPRVLPLAPEAPSLSTPLPTLQAPDTTVPVTLPGERKQVTVLFADLKDSLALIYNLDPEVAQQLLDPALQRMIEAVHHYGGTVNQVLGDGIMALFGAPMAQEDHAVRACYAALAMQAALLSYAEEVHRTHGLAMQCRVGLNSGEVVVRTIHNDVHMDYSAVGQTTHLAARMQQLAAPDTITLTAATARLAEGFVQIQALGRMPVKGMPEPVAMLELRGTSAVHSRFQAAVARGLTRFVGREPELVTLRQALERAGAGHGQVVAVIGEPGMGKTRLAYEGVRTPRTQGWLVLESAAVSYGQATPYLPVVSLLTQYFHLKEGEPSPIIQNAVTGQVLALDDTLRDIIPALLGLLNALPDDSPFLTLDPAQRRRFTQEALKRLLVRESQTQPLMLVVENLHWLDTETQAWLDTMVESLPAVPILLMVNYRPGYQHGWGSKTYYTQLRLDPLSVASATALLRDLLGSDPSLAPLAQFLMAHTENNPFFLEESVRTLVEMQALVGTRGAYRLVQALPTIHIPATVHAMLAARIDHLLPADKQLLQTAAVVGMEVPLPVLQAVTALPEAELQQSLGHLRAAEFLYETRLFPTPAYTFRHALTRQAAYQSLLLSARQQLHQQIAHVFTTRFPALAETQPERLAHHYTEAGRQEQAIAYWQQAGERALQQAANPAAIQHLTTALELLASLPETTALVQQELDLQVAMGPAFMAMKGLGSPEVEQTYARARVLCTRIGETPQLFPTLWGLCRFYQSRGDLQTARELGEQLWRLAERATNPIRRLQAHEALGHTLFHLGEYSAARTHLEQGVALIDLATQRHLVLRNLEAPGPRCLAETALTLWCLGYPTQAVRRSEEALALARELGHPYSLAAPQHWAAAVHYRRREVQAVEAQADALLPLATAQGFPLFMGFGTCWRGWALTMRGQGEAGLAQLRQGLATVVALEHELARPQCLVPFAEAAGQVGQVMEGLRLLAAALTALQASKRGDLLAEVYRLQGTLLLRQTIPDTAQAEACFQQALAIARHQQARSWELRAATSLSRLWQQQGKRAAARQLLAPLYDWFTEGFDTADLQDARAFLEAL